MTLLGGRYETLKAIASGGMATVHLGRAVGVGGFERLVAIKVMHPHIAGDPDFVTMFLDEARLAARIRHPNVVPTLDVQQTEDGLFLVMELIDGPSLKHMRRRLRKAAEKRSPQLQGCRSGGRLPLSIIVRIMIDVLAGLDAAHVLADDQGQPLRLIHRDVTPANILVGADGQTRLTDFGVARAETRLSSTRGGQLKGKVPYMPPEQLLGERLDQRGDIYAAGVVLWEELVGRRLFKADNEGALLQCILDAEVLRPRHADRQIPEALDAVVMGAIARDPNARYPTAAAFGEALEAAARSAGITIASARAVAAFLTDSGVHKPLDAKELGALKTGAVPSSRAVGLSSDDASGPSQPIPPSHSGITATEATYSTAEPTTSSSPRALVGGALIGGLVIALLGLGGGFLMATRGGDARPGTSPPATTPAVASSETSAAHDAPSTTAAASARAPSPSASTSASSTPSPGTLSPSSAAEPRPPSTPQPSSQAVSPPPVRPPVAPVSPAPPRPKPGTFNPDRL